MRTRRLFLALWLNVVAACSGSDPDAELRELVAAAEAAAEERDGGFFRGLLAPDFRDARGNDRDAMLNLVRGYLLTYSNIEIISRVEEVNLSGADAAHVVLQAAIVSRRAGQRLLSGVDGQMYRIELELVRDDDWRVIGASYGPAVRGQ